jgi:NAD(P)-dependent dehydrogenase (short-subunit alcohol dehydrogenase family)
MEGNILEIAGTVALVTGAGRGIGRAFTQALLDQGAAKVYAGVRDVSRFDGDPRLVPVALDVTDPEQVAALGATLTDVTLVVNNAGIASIETPLQSDLAVARREIETNYLGTVSVTQAFAPVLAANGGGGVITMLSVLSWVAPPLRATYAASKAAQWAWTNAVRVQLRQQNTRVVGVYVGPVDTDMASPDDADPVAPEMVAQAALRGLTAGDDEVLVDELTRAVKSAMHDDLALLYPEFERAFLAGRG